MRTKSRARKYCCMVIGAIALVSVSAQGAYCVDSASKTDFTVSVQTVFSLEFYTDANVIYSDTVPFTNVDPREAVVYPDNRYRDDGKSDTGVVCRSNAGVVWFLKLHALSAPPLTYEKIKYYTEQPYDRNTGERADGTLARSPNWYSIAPDPTTIYTAGYKDKSNLPFGTLSTFNFAINPENLEGGKGYSAAITYTMTTTT